MKRKTYSLALSSIAISVLALNTVAAEKHPEKITASTKPHVNAVEAAKPHSVPAEATRPTKLASAIPKKLVKIAEKISHPVKITEAEALKLGTEAYIYGYPLITMDLTRQIMTNVVTPDAGRAPMGQFSSIRQYPDAASRNVSAPNTDTLYSVAWIDVSKEPYVIHTPDENGRYYSMPMLSAWTDVFEVPGTRTTGAKAHDYAIVGPNWKGTLPQGLTQIKSPTSMVWILERIYCAGTQDDYAAVRKLQDEHTIMPLSYYGKPYTPPANVVNPGIDMNTPVRDQVNALDAGTYFKRLAALMKDNPPSKADAPMVAKLARLGILPGRDFDLTKMDPAEVNGLKAAVKKAQEQILAQVKNAGEVKNGWTYTTNTGLYGTNYLQRAFIAAIGLGANRPQDAIYPTALEDSAGKKLNGANKYIIHFAKNELPPVRGFWSLTMYDNKYFFVENPIKRYSLNERSHLKQNKDGSVDIYIQNTPPDKDKESNWLPAPDGDFILMFRFYWPKEALIDGKWNPPAVKKV
jgi:DNA sulfur modification protein DndE